MKQLLLSLFIFFGSVYAQESTSDKLLIHSIDSLKAIRQEIDRQMNVLISQLSRARQIQNKTKSDSKPGKFFTVKLSMDAKFKEEPSPLGKVISNISRNETLRIKYDYGSDYLITEYKGKSGYIHSMYFRTLPPQLQKQINNWKEDKRLIRLRKRWSVSTARKIIDRKIWIGMTDEMTRESLGRPKDINRSTYSFGVHEQWIYPNNKYLYFEEGILKSWQD
mgnify:FL=1